MINLIHILQPYDTCHDHSFSLDDEFQNHDDMLRKSPFVHGHTCTDFTKSDQRQIQSIRMCEVSRLICELSASVEVVS